MVVIRTVPDPVLRQVCRSLDFDDPEADPVGLAALLTETVRERQGLGLAAPQLGLAVRAFVLSGTPETVVFNPRIVDRSEAVSTLDEGCLSMPGMLVKVTRPVAIRARFQLHTGQFETVKLTGLTARVFQHELDHLDGVLMTDGVGRVRLDMAIRKAARRGFRYAHSDLRRREHDETTDGVPRGTDSRQDVQ